MNKPAHSPPRKDEDAAQAIKFFAVKAAIFILFPMAVAAIAVVVLLK